MGFFSPNAGAAVKLENVGDSITGIISGALTERQAQYNGQPRTTKKGQPVMEIVVPITDQMGNERTLYVSAWRMKRAITDAVTVSGAKDIEQGGMLTVTFSGHEQGEGSQPAKTFTAQYTPAGQAAAPAPTAPAAPQSAPMQQNPGQYGQPQYSNGGYQQQPTVDNTAPYGQPMQQGGYVQQPMTNSAPMQSSPQQYGYAPTNSGPAPLTN